MVLVNFRTSRCAPCRAPMSSLDRLRRQVDGRPFRDVAVNLDQRRADIEAFFGSLTVKPTFEALPDRDERTPRSGPVHGLPTTLVIDPDGRASHASHRARRQDGAEVRDLVDALRQPAQPDRT